MKQKKVAKTIGNIRFSPREFDVISCLLLGKTSRKSIASQLNISTTTVATYMSSIMKKLSCSSWEHVRTFAEKHGNAENIRSHFQQPHLHNEKAPHFLLPLNNKRIGHLFGNKEAFRRNCFIFTLFLIICSIIYFSIRQIIFKKDEHAEDECLKPHVILPLLSNSSKEDLYALPQQTVENEETIPENCELKLMDKSLIFIRDYYINKITECFAASSENSDSNNPIVTLIGVGGAGKTTLARIWAKHYKQNNKKNIIWEINAETQEALLASFIELAEVLSTSYTQKESLSQILSLHDEHIKYKELIRFIKKSLARQKEWLLIFDNVENYSESKPYLPIDSYTWGRGRVLITTRNAQLKYADVINPNNVIHVGEMTPEEQRALFQQISKAYNEHGLIDFKQKYLEELLKTIPPFPLDTVIVARQLSQNNMTCEMYLSYLKKNDEEHSLILSALPKGISNYSKTRYEIIAQALEKIIDKNHRFSDLILLISFVDSQNIPVNLLKTNYHNSEIEEFISELQKESLITLNLNKNTVETFSLHRSVYENFHIFAKNLSKDNRPKERLQRVAMQLEEYLVQTTNNADTDNIKIMLNHVQKFLTSNLGSKNPKVQESLMRELAILNFFVGNYKKSHNILSNLIASKHFKKLPSLKQARALIFLGISMRELIGYSEALKFLNKGMTLYRNNPKANPVEVCRAMSFLGYVKRNLGDFNKARELLEESLAHYSSKSINLPSLQVEILSNLANVYKDLGEYEKAIDLFYLSLEREKSNPHIDIRTYIALFVYLGDTYNKVENYSKAEKLLLHSRQLYKKYFSETHVDFAWCNIHLGLLYNKIGKYRLALQYLEEAQPLYQQHLSKQHVAMGILYHCIGESYIGLRQYKLAKPYLYKSLEIYKRKYALKANLRVSRVLHSLGKLYIGDDKVGKGYYYLQEALFMYYQLQHIEQYLVLEDLGDLFSKYTPSINLTYYIPLFRNQSSLYYMEALSIIKKNYSSIYLAPYSRLEQKLSSLLAEIKRKMY